jgi:hypothetical protein
MVLRRISTPECSLLRRSAQRRRSGRGWMMGEWPKFLCLIAGLAALNSAASLAQAPLATAPAPNLNPSALSTVPTAPEVPVSPALPSASSLLQTPSTATNPFTGLPCSTESSLATGGTESSLGSSSLPETGAPAPQLQAPTSVFGTQGSSGQC